MSEVELEAVADQSMWADALDDRQQAALRLADAMCGSTRVLDADLVAVLRAVFTQEELAELVLVAGQANLNNRAGNAAKQLLDDGRSGRDDG